MIRRFFAGFLLTVFFIIAVPFVFAWGVYDTFTDKDFYTGEFIDLSYELLVSEFPRMVEFGEFEYLTEEDLSNLARNVLDKEDLALLVDALIQELSEATVNENGEVEIKVPLKWLASKDELVAQELTGLLYEKLPACEVSASRCVGTEDQLK